MTSRAVSVLVLCLPVLASCDRPRGGNSTLARVIAEPPGAHCPAGGQALQTGADTDHDGVLDPAEVTSTSYVCNGPGGSPGGHGAAGASTLVGVVAEPAGAHCANGGQAIRTGVDVDSDGILDASEVAATTYVCSGAQGDAGAGGAPTLFSSETLASGHASCAAGGIALHHGLDANSNGTLDASEVGGTDFVCNGASAATSLVALATEAAGGNCRFGGKAIRSGLDRNGDTLLQPGEVTSTDYVCNGAPADAGAGGLTSLVRQDDELPGAHCTFGGRAVSSGLDTDGDKELDDGEIVTTSYVCNGAPGAQGSPGARSIISLVAEAAGANCPNGGQKLLSGIDLDGNGTLGDGEVKASAYLCGGANRLYRMSEPFPGGVCPRGGVRVETGLDADADGVLDPGEIDAAKTQYACNLYPVAIAAGSGHTCALLSDGTARCWGHNGDGQLGDNSRTHRYTPVPVSGLAGASAIAGGSYHTCALLSDGTARCWGANSDGRLGDGSTTGRLTPVPVSGLAGASAIATGPYHTCALLSDGAVRCWGQNGFGQLGDGSTADRPTPVAVSGITGATAIAPGRYHTCALLSDRTVRCWGYNGDGQLGDGTTTNRLAPTTVSGVTGATAITGIWYHSCALLSDGTGRCWGANFSGSLGDNSTTSRPTPVAVSGLAGASAIAAGNLHTSALLAGGTARCWGHNLYGQLGDGTTTDRLTPVPVSNLTGATAIAAGGFHNCVLLPDGTVRCWGQNFYGQLGNNTTVHSSTPVQSLLAF